jgi:hypothetical protein
MPLHPLDKHRRYIETRAFRLAILGPIPRTQLYLPVLPKQPRLEKGTEDSSPVRSHRHLDQLVHICR